MRIRLVQHSILYQRPRALLLLPGVPDKNEPLTPKEKGPHRAAGNGSRSLTIGSKNHRLALAAIQDAGDLLVIPPGCEYAWYNIRSCISPEGEGTTSRCRQWESFAHDRKQQDRPNAMRRSELWLSFGVSGSFLSGTPGRITASRSPPSKTLAIFSSYRLDANTPGSRSP
jgi:hypothetical protein